MIFRLIRQVSTYKNASVFDTITIRGWELEVEEREKEREITIDKSQRNQTLFSIWWSLTDWQTTFINKTETRKKIEEEAERLVGDAAAAAFFTQL